MVKVKWNLNVILIMFQFSIFPPQFPLFNGKLAKMCSFYCHSFDKHKHQDSVIEKFVREAVESTLSQVNHHGLIFGYFCYFSITVNFDFTRFWISGRILFPHAESVSVLLSSFVFVWGFFCSVF